MNLETNNVKIIGEVVTQPEFCHVSHDEKFYSFKIKTPRKSNTNDVVSVLISEKIMKGIEKGKFVSINGQIRTYNKMSDGAKRLLIYVFVISIDEIENNNESNANNVINLTGFVCKKPVYRTTPFGREITDILLAVNRAYHKSDYIPCITWGRNAFYCKDFEVGTKVEITGRLQSREYNKKLEDGTVITRTAYEVSIVNIKKIEEN